MDGKHCEIGITTKIEVTEEMIEELVTLIKTLTAIPAPSHMEEKRVAFLMDYLQQSGYEPFTDEAKNVYVEVGDTGKEDKTLHLYTAHTDTVFPDTTTLPVREERGVLYGPGIGDDTANACGMLLALKYIKKAGLQPARPIVYCFDSCEEGLGNLKGMWAAFHKYEKRLARHIAFDGSTDHIVSKAVGSRRYELTVSTIGGHSYNAFGRRNAIAEAAGMISALYEMRVDDLPGKTTYNVGTITGGTSVNTIAQQCSFRMEYRSDCQEHMAIMQKRAELALSNALGQTVVLADGNSVTSGEVTVKIRLIGDRPGMGPVDEEKQTALQEHIKSLLMRYTGAEPDYTSGSTDCNIPLSRGIIAACFGIYLGELQHTREEYIMRDSLKAGMQTMFALLTEDYR